jgi:hypothetical protein
MLECFSWELCSEQVVVNLVTPKPGAKHELLFNNRPQFGKKILRPTRA